MRGIGTPEAARVKEVLARHWQILPEPPLGDPDADLLWDAEQAAQKIHALAEQPDVKQSFERRLVRYEEELSGAAQRVRTSATASHSSARSRSASPRRSAARKVLELPTTKGMPKAVLETGAGGITICEVHLRQGPGYGLIIEPCTEDEIRRHVADFANFLLNPAEPNDEEAGRARLASRARSSAPCAA